MKLRKEWEINMNKIMLLEDDPTMLSLLETLFEIEGFKVSHTLEFNNSLEAIRLFDPDIMLLDVNLRDANGLDVIAEIRQDAEHQNLTVVMSSGMDLREDCLRAGADDFILKPYMPDELVEKIKKLVNHN